MAWFNSAQAFPTFTDIGAGLTGMSDPCTARGDFDGDGDLDIPVAGYTVAGAITRVYRNTGGTFTNIVAGLEGVYRCALA